MNQTIRRYIQRRVWWCLGIGFAGWLIFPLSGVVIATDMPKTGLQVLPMVGFVLFGGALLALQWIVKCPKCKAKLGRTIAMPLAFSWGSGPKIGFCPYCGVNLDEPLPHAALGEAQTQNPLNPIK